ncbi:MAG: DUF4160 domain-containing protein [Deltaproteobacteria bacterium]|nr:DUF4160 domain-containing protein [Deltaproteobacteria bacterium]
MPTIKIIGAYRFFFYSNEGEEPPHIHVTREKSSAKFWLRPIRLAYSNGFKGAELRNLEKIVTRYQAQFLEAWDAYFKG